MKRQALVSTALLFAVLGWPAPSPAQPATPSQSAAPAADPATKARERFRQGVAFGKKNDWTNAYAAFLDAWRLKQHPQVALNLGRAELETGRYQDAIEHLRYCIDHSPAGDPDIALARDWLAEAEKKSAKLTVTVNADSVRILVDERLVGRSPLTAPILLDPGSHIVEARRFEERAARGIVAESGASITVDLTFEPAADPIPGPSGETHAPPPSPSPFPRTALLIGGGAGTFVGLAIGAITAGISVVGEGARDNCLAPAGSSWEAYQARKPCWDHNEEIRVTMARASFGGFMAAGLFGLATGAVWFFAPAPKGSSVAVAPVLSPAAGGFQLAGTF